MSDYDNITIGLRSARAEIENQHRRLAVLVSRIERAIRKQKNPHTITKLLDRLIAAAQAHFDYEAYVQNSLGLGETAFHRGSTMKPDSLKNLRDRYVDGRPPSASHAMSILGEWLERHYPAARPNHNRLIDRLRFFCSQESAKV